MESTKFERNENKLPKERDMQGTRWSPWDTLKLLIIVLLMEAEDKDKSPKVPLYQARKKTLRRRRGKRTIMNPKLCPPTVDSFACLLAVRTEKTKFIYKLFNMEGYDMELIEIADLAPGRH